MVIPITVLFLGIGYLYYQSKDEVFLIEKETNEEKDEVYKGIDDLFI